MYIEIYSCNDDKVNMVNVWFNQTLLSIKYKDGFRYCSMGKLEDDEKFSTREDWLEYMRKDPAYYNIVYVNGDR